MIRAVRISVVITLLTLAGASATVARVTWVPHSVMVMVSGPTLDPSLRYELVIGATAFMVEPGRRGGSARVKTDDSQTVTLRAIPGCQLITRFTARSGHLYDIYLSSPTHARASEAFGDTETPLNAESNERCTLPPTDVSTTGSTPGSSLLRLAVLPLAGAVGFAMGLRRIRRRAGSHQP
jgi:hypothetical protein